MKNGVNIPRHLSLALGYLKKIITIKQDKIMEEIEVKVNDLDKTAVFSKINHYEC